MNPVEQIKGSLLGLAWGDILGSPIEGWQSRAIKLVFGKYRLLPDQYPLARIAPFGKRVLKRLRPLGIHTDDAQQAMALLNVCLAPAGWSSDTWAAWLVEGMDRKAWRGYGRNFSSAVSNLRKGALPQEAGRPTAGVGAVMRIGPLGALYRDDPELLGRVVMESSLVTHGDIRVGAMAYAVAYAVAWLIAGRSSPEIKTALPEAVALEETRWLEGHPEWTIDRAPGHLISHCLGEFFGKAMTSPAQVRKGITSLARAHVDAGATRLNPNQAFVLLGGLHGLAMGLFEGKDPEAVLAEILGQGYDTDTVAAIAGSILGARFGTAWIPVPRFLDRERLEAYAEALVHRQGPPEDRDAFMKREADLTRQEESYQANLVEKFG
jgi:ADP-ribosylglycohydrolase